jgi:CysZ protein
MLKEIIIAIQSYADAHRFILKHRLWKWIYIPGILYSLLFMAGMYLFWKSSNHAIEFILLKSGIKNWLDRMHETWLNWLFIMGQLMLHLVLLLFYFSLFKYLFLILASPVFAFLSEKTDSILQGRDYPFSLRQLLLDIGRAIRIALRNMLWQTVYVVSVMIVSLIPVIGWIAPVVLLLIECYYLGFSMIDYNCERNKLSAAESIDFIGHHRGLAIGNGGVFYVLHLIPLIGWLFAPSYAVIAATLSLHKARSSKVIIGA